MSSVRVDLSGYPVMLSTEQVAEILGVHIDTVRRMIKERELPAKKLGRVWRVSRQELQIYLVREDFYDDTEGEAT